MFKMFKMFKMFNQTELMSWVSFGMGKYCNRKKKNRGSNLLPKIPDYGVIRV